MTKTFTKGLIACAAISTLFAATAAHAGDSFNKFPVQPTQTNRAVVKMVKPVTTQSVGSRTVITTQDGSFRTRTVKRVVETSVTADADADRTLTMRRFNKMTAKLEASGDRMPVLFDPGALNAR